VSAGACADCGASLRKKESQRCVPCANRHKGRRGAEKRWAEWKPTVTPTVKGTRRKMRPEEKREAMEWIREQVEAGELVIRFDPSIIRPKPPRPSRRQAA
jgi:hypothetical protein